MITKFRAWHEDSKTMYEVKSIVYTLGALLGVNREALYAERTLYFEDTPVMQSTGLFDKNGKEIFEGDVLKWYYSEGIELQQEGVSVVVFENGAFRTDKDSDITLYEMLEDCDYMEVIGNIYENPELLKGN